jgi:ADP-ribose pyrophosphatase YjhB (NUDIX family)
LVADEDSATPLLPLLELPPLPDDPEVPQGPPTAEAAVLALLRRRKGVVEILLIERAQREGDPWSGQMALPGGHKEEKDRDLGEAALRELEEEVGLSTRDLAREPAFLAIRRPANRPWMRIGAFVGVLRDGAEGVPIPGPEVATALWVPLRELEPTAGPIEVATPRGPWKAEALVYRRHIVWGFTRRVLLDLMPRLEALR